LTDFRISRNSQLSHRVIV